MEFHTVREFRDKATTILRSTEPVFVTRRGKLAGVYMPVADGELPHGHPRRRRTKNV